MPDDNRNIELILLGITVGAIATYLVMMINNQLQLLNQNISTYNQYALYQQYQPPLQIQQPQQLPQPSIQTQPKRLYTVERDSEGYIKLPD